jgi:hypothetical protein
LPFAFVIEEAANSGGLRTAAVHPGGPLWVLTLKSLLTEIVELKSRTETKNRNDDTGIKYLK